MLYEAIDYPKAQLLAKIKTLPDVEIFAVLHQAT